jgi:hypothetical protein
MTLSVRMPNSMHETLKDITKEDQVSINQFVNSAIAEKISALLTEKYLNERAKKGNEEAYLDVLSSVPSVEPNEKDKL